MIRLASNIFSHCPWSDEPKTSLSASRVRTHSTVCSAFRIPKRTPLGSHIKERSLKRSNGIVPPRDVGLHRAARSNDRRWTVSAARHPQFVLISKVQFRLVCVGQLFTAVWARKTRVRASPERLLPHPRRVSRTV